MTFKPLSRVPFSHPWHEKTMGDIATIVVGGTPSTEVKAYWGGNIPWMASGDVHLKHITAVDGRITNLGLRSSNATLVEPPAVAVALAGQGKTRGTAAKILTRLCTNQSVALIVGRPEELHPDYLFHNLEFRYEELRARSSGGGRGGLSKGILEDTPLPTPNYTEQARIAGVLDALDEAIRGTEAVILKLQHIRMDLLFELIFSWLRMPREAKQADFKCASDSLFFGKATLPPRWQWKRLSDLAEVERGKFTYRPRNEPKLFGGQYPFIQTGDVVRAFGNEIHTASQWLNELGMGFSREFPAGTIAVTIAANIADTAILGIPMCFPDSVVGVVVQKPNNNRFIELCLRVAKHGLEARAPQSAQKNINLQDLRPLFIPTPPPEEQARIAAIYESHESRIRLEAGRLEKLRALKTGLTSDLLTGRVRVPMEP